MENIYDVIIIGAGCAGLTAAVYAKRAGKKVLLIESMQVGGQITSSPLVENFPGFTGISGLEFSDRLFEQIEKLSVEFEFDTVTEVSLFDEVKTVKTDYSEFFAKNIIIATGAEHRKLGIEKEEELIGKGVSYCAICDGAFYKGQDVCVIGGGNSAFQSALYLSGICAHVTLIHRRDEFRADSVLIEKARNTENIEFITNAIPKKFLTDGKGEVCGLTVSENGESKDIVLSGVFVCIGQKPNTGLFAPFVKTDASGYIAAGEDCKTDIPGVFAAGDCRTKLVRQLTTAAADGANAALSLK